jgi:uncharacterized protein (DUF1499 family)
MGKIGYDGGFATISGVSMIFSGKRPTHLGAKNGKLASPSKKPNSVSSQADKGHPAHIAPLALSGDPAKAWKKLQEQIAAMRGASIVKSEAGYIHAEFKSSLMGYVDDVEFLLDGKQVQVRSASRLGYSDLGVNRKRIEQIRAMLA